MKLIFARGPIVGFRAVFLILISIALMTLDHRNQDFSMVKGALSTVVTPIQYLVDIPIDTLHWIGENFTTRNSLMKENEQLRQQQLLLTAKLQKFLALEQENAQLRKLLNSVPRVSGSMLVAQLLAVDPDPFVHQVILNKGKSAAVFVGQPVLDANGVMGQVVQVNSLTSQVLLITDTRSAVPVQDSRNGVRAIAIGTGALDTLKLAYVPKTTQVKIGDLFVTSGLGQHFPIGYPVGVVKSVENEPGAQFATITIKPTAHLDRSRQVLLVWPYGKKHAKNALAEQ